MDNQTLPSKQNEPSSLKYDGPTPGPWKFEAVHGVTVFAPSQQICRVRCDSPNPRTVHQAITNARLIAAAPELLAALQMLHDDIAEYASINNLGGFDNHAMRTARAAIAKATGAA